MGVYEGVAAKLRDDCHFVMYKGSPAAGDDGAKIMFKSKTHEETYIGDMNNPDAMLYWVTEQCSPLVREITFQNGEELTEEGLPFLIMFYNPEDHEPVVQFTDAVKARLSGERGQVNFITADGHKFAHPLRHLGKTKKDLPILAIDTFKHMYLFNDFNDIHTVQPRPFAVRSWPTAEPPPHLHNFRQSFRNPSSTAHSIRVLLRILTLALGGLGYA
jgi:endoplasmic reticulum resident protein 44